MTARCSRSEATSRSCWTCAHIACSPGCGTCEDQAVYSLRFSPDGRTLFAAMTTAWTQHDHPAVRSAQRPGARRGAVCQPPPGVRDAPCDARRPAPGDELRGRLHRDPRRPHAAPADAVAGAAPTAAALSRDDDTLLLGGRDGSVRFLDLVGGRVLTASGRHGGAVVHASFSADGRTAVTAGADERVIVWNVRRAAAGETLQGHAGRITGNGDQPRRPDALYERAGRQGPDLGSRGAQRLGRPFEIGADGSRRGNRRDVGAVATYLLPSHAVSPDGQVLAVGQSDGTVRLIDARTMRLRSSFRAVSRGPVRSLGYVPGGRLLAVGGDQGFLALVDPRRGTLVKSLPGHRGSLLSISFSADGRRMLTAALHPTAAPCYGSCRQADASARQYRAPASIGSERVAEPRRADAGHHARVVRRRDRRRGHGSAYRIPAAVRDDRLPRALHARRPLHRRRQLQGLGTAVVHQDVAACRAGC